jgi:hypothetical protein
LDVQYGHVYKDDAKKAQQLEVSEANVAFNEALNGGNNKFSFGVN